MTASGALGYDGKGWPWERPLSLIGLFDPTLFTSVTKTLTLHPMKGNLRWYNPFRCIRFLNDGVVNTVALSNPGIDWWCKNISPSLDSRKIPLVVSLFGEPDELAKMAKMLNEFDIAGIELNASCPNTTTTILQDTDRIIASCKAITAETKLPLILKVSVSHDVEVITKGIVSMVQAISINSVPWTKIFPNTRSPLTQLGGGGISGKVAQTMNWNLMKNISDLTSIPVIGPSIWEFNDLEKVRTIGAKAISFGSIFLRYPWRPTVYVRKEKQQ